MSNHSFKNVYSTYQCYIPNSKTHSHLNVIQESTFAHKVAGFVYTLICIQILTPAILENCGLKRIAQFIRTHLNQQLLGFSCCSPPNKKKKSQRVNKYDTFVPSKLNMESWVADRADPEQRCPKKTVFLWWAERKSNMMNSCPFVIWKQFCIFPLHVIALQFIFWSRDFVKVESSQRQQLRELHSPDLHVAEVVR